MTSSPCTASPDGAAVVEVEGGAVEVVLAAVDEGVDVVDGRDDVVDDEPGGREVVVDPAWENTAASFRPQAARAAAPAPSEAARVRNARRDTAAKRDPGGPKVPSSGTASSGAGSGASAAAAGSIGGP